MEKYAHMITNFIYSCKTKIRQFMLVYPRKILHCRRLHAHVGCDGSSKRSVFLCKIATVCP